MPWANGGTPPPTQSPPLEDPFAKFVELGGNGCAGSPFAISQAPHPTPPPAQSNPGSQSGIWRNPSLGFLSPVPAAPSPVLSVQPYL